MATTTTPVPAPTLYEPGHDPTVAVAASAATISSRVCGVFLGYPTLLVWAQVTVRDNDISALQYVLGDGTRVRMHQVALTKSFLTRSDRRLAAIHLGRLAQNPTHLLSSSLLPEHVDQKTVEYVQYVVKDITSVPDQHLAELAGIYARTHQQLALSIVTKRARGPMEKELEICGRASRRLSDEYNVEIEARRVFSALVALGVSGVAGRRITGSREAFWSTDDYVLRYGSYLRNNKSQQLGIKPDPADFVTAAIMDEARASGDSRRLRTPATSVALTPDLFEDAPALRMCLAG